MYDTLERYDKYHEILGTESRGNLHDEHAAMNRNKNTTLISSTNVCLYSLNHGPKKTRIFLTSLEDCGALYQDSRYLGKIRNSHYLSIPNID